MSGSAAPPEPPSGSAGPVVPAFPEPDRGFSLVWLVPIVALLIGGWLVFRFLTQEGPMVTLIFSTADGITAGQTQIRHKAVALGLVKSVTLTHDMTHVIVRARMRRSAEPLDRGHDDGGEKDEGCERIHVGAEQLLHAAEDGGGLTAAEFDGGENGEDVGRNVENGGGDEQGGGARNGVRFAGMDGRAAARADGAVGAEHGGPTG